MKVKVISRVGDLSRTPVSLTLLGATAMACGGGMHSIASHPSPGDIEVDGVQAEWGEALERLGEDGVWFAAMNDDYPMMNGRGYPDTTVAGPLLPAPAGSTDPISPQQVSSLITATQGQTILLRVINLGQVQSYTVTALGVPMQVVGRGARLLPRPTAWIVG